ncbi:MAG: DsbA family protein [Pseudomonadota bacterium]
MMTISRRRLLGCAAAAPALGLPLTVFASDDPRVGDIVIGEPNAPVTVIEYLSLTCPHCKRFHTSTWPEFKKNYVDTGKVRFVMRDVFLNEPGFWAGLVARCGGHQGYGPMVDQFFKKQGEWTSVPPAQMADEIRKIGKLNGLSHDAVEACLSDQTYARAVFEDSHSKAQADGVNSTPTFIINGEKVVGNRGYAEFSAIVDKHL